MIELVEYRDLWLSEKMKEVIGFYPREFYCLDNFSSFKVNHNGYVYSTAEEAYQAAKFHECAPEIVYAIRNSFSAHEAQKIARENSSLQRADWEKIKLRTMEDILRAKVQQNPYVLKKLLQTKNYTIVEDSPKDNYCGWGPYRNGENMLGRLWMKIRDDIIIAQRNG